tara:strand:- start:16 stop:471 length:456 start_codon:yes stop_codon:yes gene_type:complete
MVKASFSTGWKRSTQVRKQRKYRYNAPLHLRQKMLHVHLSADLRKKYAKRNVQVRTGDKVRVLRGQYSKKEGKVERVLLKKEKVYVTGIELIKKEGTKIPVGLNPSNLMIIDLNLADKKRKSKLGAEKKAEKKTVTALPEKTKEAKNEKTS